MSYFQQDMEQIFKSFLKTAENIICYWEHSKEERTEKLKELFETVYKSCKNGKKMIKLQKTIETLQAGDSTNEEEIMGLFNKEKKKLESYDPDASKEPRVLEFMQQVRELIATFDKSSQNADDTMDDDIQFTQNEINVIDPFSKKRMVDPVKNKVCNHVYDKNTVEEVLKMNPRTRCPVVGCSSKHPIVLANLAMDIPTSKYLLEHPE